MSPAFRSRTRTPVTDIAPAPDEKKTRANKPQFPHVEGKRQKLYLFGVNRDRFEEMARDAAPGISIVDNLNDANLDPARLRPARDGRPEEFGVDEILACLTGPMTHKEWFAACEETGISRSTFCRRVKAAAATQQITKTGKTWTRQNAPGYPGEKDV